MSRSARRSSRVVRVRPFPMLRPAVMLRPSMILRRKALMSGVLGNSTLWRAAAVVLFGSSTLRRMFGKQPEVVEVAVLKGPGHLMQIETLPPRGRRRRRRSTR
jgi:hypothetical protein